MTLAQCNLCSTVCSPSPPPVVISTAAHLKWRDVQCKHFRLEVRRRTLFTRWFLHDMLAASIEGDDAY